MFRNDEPPIREFQDILECLSHSHIGRHPSLKGDRSDKGLSLADVALEISGQGITETGDDVIVRRGDLLKVNHIRFGKDTASSGNAGRIFRFKGKLAEFFDGETQPARLLIQKRTGAGSTERVHREITDLEMAILLFDKDQFRVLSSDIDDRPDLRIKMLNRFGLRDDLVHEMPFEEFGEQFPSGAGKREAVKLLGWNAAEDLL